MPAARTFSPPITANAATSSDALKMIALTRLDILMRISFVLDVAGPLLAYLHYISTFGCAPLVPGCKSATLTADRLLLSSLRHRLVAGALAAFAAGELLGFARPHDVQAHKVGGARRPLGAGHHAHHVAGSDGGHSLQLAFRAYHHVFGVRHVGAVQRTHPP